jgi:hypothetical protein
MSLDSADLPPGTDPEASDADRRIAERFRILQRCLVRPADSPGSVGWKGIVYDLSARGIGLALPYPLAVGTSLVIDPAGQTAAQPVHARVVRVHPVSYLWFCGCELAADLPDDELHAWLLGPVQQPAARPEPALR